MLTAIALQIEPLNANSAISIGLMLSILAGAIYLSRAMTRTEEQLRQINEKLSNLSGLPDRVKTLENQIGNLQNDLNNLWESFRAMRGEDGGTLGNTRRARGPY